LLLAGVDSVADVAGIKERSTTLETADATRIDPQPSSEDTRTANSTAASEQPFDATGGGLTTELTVSGRPIPTKDLAEPSEQTLHRPKAGTLVERRTHASTDRCQESGSECHTRHGCTNASAEQELLVCHPAKPLLKSSAVDSHEQYPHFKKSAGAASRSPPPPEQAEAKSWKPYTHARPRAEQSESTSESQHSRRLFPSSFVPHTSMSHVLQAAIHHPACCETPQFVQVLVPAAHAPPFAYSASTFWQACGAERTTEAVHQRWQLSSQAGATTSYIYLPDYHPAATALSMTYQSFETQGPRHGDSSAFDSASSMFIPSTMAGHQVNHPVPAALWR
jgi:hypothetical protein